MPPRALSFPAPSRSLLRYLRAQSEEVASLDPGKGSSCTAFGDPFRCPLRSPAGKVRQSSRSLSTTKTGRSADLQAGILGFDLILPKFLRKPRRTATVSEAQVLAASRRYASDDHTPSVLCKPSWQERIFGTQASRSASKVAAKRPNPKPEDMPEPEPDSDSIFSPSRTQAAKAALEPRLRCTEVDENGEVIMVDGEFKKSELIAKYGLLPRDLRKIDASNLPHILVRPQAILLNLLHLKVLIKHDRVLLFDVYGSKTSFPQSAFMYDLQGKLQQKQAPGAGGLPYEFRALEAVLTSVTSELEAEFETVQAPVIRILSELEDDIDRDKLRILLVLSKKVSSFEQKAKLVRDAIEELLEADDDLSAMYLTEKAHDIYRPEDDHTEIEMLLEAYDRVCDEVAQEASNLVSSIRNTEEIIRAILDSNRNSLMLLDLKFSVGTLGLAMGTFLAGLYGMNLENFIEETNWGFGTVTSMSALASLIVCWYGLVKLRKVQRVKILSSRTQDKNHWFREDGAGGLLDARNREKLRQINMLKATYKKKAWFRT